MDFLILGFMVTSYLKEIGFNAKTDFERVVDVVEAYVKGYLGYTREEESNCVNVSVLTKHDGELFVVLSKGVV